MLPIELFEDVYRAHFENVKDLKKIAVRFMSVDEEAAKKTLQGQPNGSYVVCVGDKPENDLTLCYVTQGKVERALFRKGGNGYVSVDDPGVGLPQVLGMLSDNVAIAMNREIEHFNAKLNHFFAMLEKQLAKQYQHLNPRELEQLVRKDIDPVIAAISHGAPPSIKDIAAFRTTALNVEKELAGFCKSLGLNAPALEARQAFPAARRPVIIAKATVKMVNAGTKYKANARDASNPKSSVRFSDPLEIGPTPPRSIKR